MKKSFGILLALLAMGGAGSNYFSDAEPSVESLMEADGVEVRTVDDIPAIKIKEVPAEVIREVPAEVIKALPVERLREIPIEVLKAVPVEVLASVPVETLKAVPIAILAAVPVEVLKAVSVEVLTGVPVEVLKSVPVAVLAGVPIEVLKSVPIAVLAGVPVEVLKSVPVETLKTVPIAILASVPVETLRRVPAEILTSVPVELLRSVSASVLASIPVEAIREVAAKKLPDQKELKELIAFYGGLQGVFADTDNLKWHRMSAEVKSDLSAWTAIYKDYARNKPAPPAKIGIAKGLRMISFMRLPESPAAWRTLRSNLAYYKQEGYNAVLFLAEDIERLDDTLKLIRTVKADYGLAVWAAYGPDGEGYNAPVTFLNPERYRSWLKALAPELAGWILGYKRTGCHLFVQDAAYIHHVVSALREGNAALPVAGELYYGYTYRFRSDHTAYYSSNTFSGACADVIQNRGHLTVDKTTALKQLDKPGIGVVIGRKIEYLTKTGDTWSAARKIKLRIERDYIRSGAIGVITEHGDGNSTIRRGGMALLYNDLSKTLYSDLNGFGS